ncbi:MAG TPA: hypothetical protein VFI16_05465 [Anaeromyxobacteraceae bacterium]|nr:hypothetical protein [Anaeromyxobacteraceae bacterium]
MSAAARRLAAAGLALAALLGGCRGEAQRRVAEDAIRRYNRAVAEAHLTGSLEALEKVASEREAERVQIFVAAVRGQGQVLEQSLEELRVAEAVFEPGKARALAEERWVYRRLDARTRQPVSGRADRRFLMTYVLAKRGDEWVVERVEFAKPSEETSPAVPAGR